MNQKIMPVDKSENFFINVFFPKFCLGCKKDGVLLCEDCRSLLDISEYNYCLCDKAQRFLQKQAEGKCRKCSDKKLAGLYFALSYKDNALVQKLIRQFKYEPYLKSLSKILAGILIEHFVKTGANANEIWENSVLIPVPMNIKNKKERGYSQTEELAKELSPILKLPVLIDVLIKAKTTKPQAGLSKFDREQNLLNAFSLNKSGVTSDVTPLSGKKIFLVDDVYTTGSTMNECAKVLRKAGAKSVWGIALAREG